MYRDPILVQKKQLLRLAQRLWQSGMLGFAMSAREEVSLFGVVKKYDGRGQRWLFSLLSFDRVRLG